MIAPALFFLSTLLLASSIYIGGASGIRADSALHWVIQLTMTGLGVWLLALLTACFEQRRFRLCLIFGGISLAEGCILIIMTFAL